MFHIVIMLSCLSSYSNCLDNAADNNLALEISSSVNVLKVVTIKVALITLNLSMKCARDFGCWVVLAI